jgi:hypothetical protein
MGVMFVVIGCAYENASYTSGPGTGFNVPHSGDMPQLPPTYFLGGMSNAVMTMDDPGSYEIAPEVYELFLDAGRCCRFLSWAGFQGRWFGLALLSMLVIGGDAGLERNRSTPNISNRPLDAIQISTALNTASPRQ